MPSKRQYDPVVDDGFDPKSPFHSDTAFKDGIFFQAKYIGTLEVPRPSSRVEIVAAMRRIRYEFKAKAVKKQKVVFCISVDGVKVATQKKESKEAEMDSRGHQISYSTTSRIQNILCLARLSRPENIQLHREGRLYECLQVQCIQVIQEESGDADCENNWSSV